MFKHLICHSCDKKGHIRKACKSSKQQYKTQKPYQHNRDGHYVDLDQDDEHWVNVEQIEEEVDNDLSILKVGRTSTTTILVKLVMELDSRINCIRGTTS